MVSFFNLGILIQFAGENGGHQAIVAGAIVGVLALVVLIVSVTVCFTLRCRKRRNQGHPKPTIPAESPSAEEGESPTTLLTRSLVGEPAVESAEHLENSQSGTTSSVREGYFSRCPDLLGTHASDDNTSVAGDQRNSTLYHKPFSAYDGMGPVSTSANHQILDMLNTLVTSFLSYHATVHTNS